MVIDYLLKNGNERVIQEFRQRQFLIKTLQEFNYIGEDDQDVGLSVRARAKAIIELLNDDKRLASERKAASKNKDKYSQAVGSSTGFRVGQYSQSRTRNETRKPKRDYDEDDDNESNNESDNENDEDTSSEEEVTRKKKPTRKGSRSRNIKKKREPQVVQETQPKKEELFFFDMDNNTSFQQPTNQFQSNQFQQQSQFQQPTNQFQQGQFQQPSNQFQQGQFQQPTNQFQQSNQYQQQNQRLQLQQQYFQTQPTSNTQEDDFFKGGQFSTGNTSDEWSGFVGTQNTSVQQPTNTFNQPNYGSKQPTPFSQQQQQQQPFMQQTQNTQNQQQSFSFEPLQPMQPKSSSQTQVKSFDESDPWSNSSLIDLSSLGS